MTEPELTTTEIRQLLEDLSLDPDLRARLELLLAASLPESTPQSADGIPSSDAPRGQQGPTEPQESTKNTPE